MCHGTAYDLSFVTKHPYGRWVVLYAPYRIRTKEIKDPTKVYYRLFL